MSVELQHIHPEPGLHGRGPQERCNPAVPKFLRGIPDHFIARESALLRSELGRVDFDLLQADHIGLLLPHPVQCMFRQRGAQAVDVP